MMLLHSATPAPAHPSPTTREACARESLTRLAVLRICKIRGVAEIDVKTPAQRRASEQIVERAELEHLYALQPLACRVLHEVPVMLFNHGQRRAGESRDVERRHPGTQRLGDPRVPQRVQHD